MDNVSLSNNPELIAIDPLIDLLYESERNISEIADLLPGNVQSTSFCHDFLEKYCLCFNKNELQYFRLKNKKFFNIVCPYAPMNCSLAYLAELSHSSPSTLSQFPETPNCLFKYLEHPLVFAVMFAALIDSESPHEILHLVLNILLQIYSHTPRSEEIKNVKSIQASSIEEIANQLPESFSDKMNALITYQNTTASLVSLLANRKPLGPQLLSQMNLLNSSSSLNAGSDSTQLSNASLKFKSLIMTEFQSRLNAFDSLDDIDDKEEEKCLICGRSKQNEVFAYPIFLYLQTIHSFLDKTISLSPAYSYHICLHPVHVSCLPHNGLTMCPLCRVQKNHFLPILPPGDLSQKEEEALRRFLKFFSPGPNNQYESLFFSFCSYFTCADYRMRNDPHSLQNSCDKAIVRCLFNILTHIKASVTPTAPFFAFILELIASRNPENSFHSLVRKYLPSDVSQVEFLRRSMILDTLLFDKLDPDSAGDVPSTRCNYHLQSQVLSPFPMINLPKRFIDLSRSPMSYPLHLASESLALSLFTGDVVDYSPQHKSRSFTHINVYIEQYQFQGAVPFICISGDEITLPFLFLTSTKKNKVIPPLYVDSHGFSDFGFKRNADVYLSEKNLKLVIELLLSGSWVPLI